MWSDSTAIEVDDVVCVVSVVNGVSTEWSVCANLLASGVVVFGITVAVAFGVLPVSFTGEATDAVVEIVWSKKVVDKVVCDVVGSCGWSGNVCPAESVDFEATEDMCVKSVDSDEETVCSNVVSV